MNKQITIGIVAHVDAGKTTLSEAILYNTRAISDVGRVDHGSSHLDTDSIEQARGITVFSSQANFTIGNTTVTLIDTPGHSDLSAETERALYILDYAILIISASEGVQSHTRTLWRLLVKYNIPTFVFINKIDLTDNNYSDLINQLTDTFGDGFVLFDNEPDEDTMEEIALLDEAYMDSFLEKGTLADEEISQMVAGRLLFPCFCGCALKNTGVEKLLGALDKYTTNKQYGDEFAAKVYKITFDSKGQRLTHLKVTGGALSIRQEIRGIKPDGEGEEDFESDDEFWNEKISEIRKYQGKDYDSLQRADAGEVVSVCGLSYTMPGMGLGEQEDCPAPSVSPVISYDMKILGDDKPLFVYKKLKALEDEWPELSLKWNEANKAISVMLMGQVQTQVLGTIIHDRFGYVVEFGQGRIAYRETISSPVEGVGHFEPLRHYAEVHLLLEPAARGSGLSFDSRCEPDTLALNWQRLVLTHLKEKKHLGVMTGSPITDMKITLVAGKAHPKHTMGGDFRQATYRAIRQGLMKAEGVLLEPYYRFTIELPAAQLGRAMTDVSAMSGRFNSPGQDGDMATLTGMAPVSTMFEYAANLSAYTAGEGRISLALAGYYPCHNSEEGIESRAYDPILDIKNPTGSVFCTHGAGYVVPWDQVEEYMHLEGMSGSGEASQTEKIMPVFIPKEAKAKKYQGTMEEDTELMMIFEREFGPVKRRQIFEKKEIRPPSGPDIGHSTEKYLAKAREKEEKKRAKRKKYLLVDGYNVIHSIDRLKELAKDDLMAARGMLADELCNYQGYTGYNIILVFDAYKVSGGKEHIDKYNGIYVVYTREAETADAYIEKATHEMAREHDVTVVSSDGMVQIIVLGAGGIRMSSRELDFDMKRVNKEGIESIEKSQGGIDNA